MEVHEVIWLEIKLDQDIMATIVVSKFEDDWTKTVETAVWTLQISRPPMVSTQYSVIHPIFLTGI